MNLSPRIIADTSPNTGICAQVNVVAAGGEHGEYTIVAALSVRPRQRATCTVNNTNHVHPRTESHTLVTCPSYTLVSLHLCLEGQVLNMIG